LGSPEGELSVLIVDDSEIAELNEQYLQRKGATNVIAFPMAEGKYSNINPHLVGDVAISIETAEREGKESGITMEDRFNQLLIHGILHLFGYNHEGTESEAVKMELKNSELLKLINQK